VQNSCRPPVVRREKKSIQETIEKTLSKILREKVKLTASGRTDAGVHALAQIANFKTKSVIPVKKLQAALNGLLPKDIVIAKAEDKPFNFHSRFSAKSKIYRYSILNRDFDSVFFKNKVYFCHYSLDISLMKEEARVLAGKHDFKAFCASGSCAKDAIRTIKNITVKRAPDEFGKRSVIAIEIEADGFVYNMIRNIVGTLIEIGRGRFKQGSLRGILQSGNRRLAGPTAPAQGLCLLAVKY
jgi:tRNA pseudouridine38-40 synthase